jgi:hypothetical protein
VYYIRSERRLHKQSFCVVGEFGNSKPVSTDREVQLKGASQRGQETPDTEAENVKRLEASTKQCSEHREGEHQSLCGIVICKV